ncbi:MAG TPA: DeoR/GlpR family DNA-binding transcription regulator [Propionibacteriaceae bacterium]|nr:DeoR/GlpR family DNA-binding transcription regulator [Propionibacteriaceae bacterium]
MLPEQRRARVAQLVRSNGAMRVSEISDALDVSPMTIRRDLELLDRDGVVHRVHGGATAGGGGGHEREAGSPPPVSEEPAFQVKRRLEAAAKRAIAQAAMSHIEPGMTIALSAGTTTYALARALEGFAGITVVTNSTDAANVLFETLPSTSLVVLTGGVRTPSHALVGPIAESSLKELQVDIVFHGFHGMDPQSGFTCPNLAEVSTAQAMIAGGDQLIVLADHSKFGVRALAKVADLSAATTLITDSRIAGDQLEELRRRIPTVEIADPEAT